MDAYLAVSTLPLEYVWRREPPDTSGIEILLGDGREIPSAVQEELAMSYLVSHHEELRKLQGFPGVEYVILGLVRICPVEVTGICVTPSVELLQQADKLGIVMTYYVTVDGRPDSKR